MTQKVTLAIETLLPCPQCDGGGEESYEPPGWWHGSGVNIQTWPCRLCKGEGEATPTRIAEWDEAEWDGP